VRQVKVRAQNHHVVRWKQINIIMRQKGWREERERTLIEKALTFYHVPKKDRNAALNFYECPQLGTFVTHMVDTPDLRAPQERQPQLALSRHQFL
jgi:hypothetical protein